MICPMCDRTPPNKVECTLPIELGKSLTVTHKGTREQRARFDIPLCDQCARLYQLGPRIFIGLGCLAPIGAIIVFFVGDLALIEMGVMDAPPPEKKLTDAEKAEAKEEKKDGPFYVIVGLAWIVFVLGGGVAFGFLLPRWGTKNMSAIKQHPFVQAAEAEGLYVDYKTYCYWGSGHKLDLT